MLVRVLHAVDENGSATKTLICEGLSERKVEAAVEDAFQRFSAGVPLDVTQRSFFQKALSELFDYMKKAVMALRWRCSIIDGPNTTFRNGKRLIRSMARCARKSQAERSLPSCCSETHIPLVFPRSSARKSLLLWSRALVSLLKVNLLEKLGIFGNNTQRPHS